MQYLRVKTRKPNKRHRAHTPRYCMASRGNKSSVWIGLLGVWHRQVVWSERALLRVDFDLQACDSYSSYFHFPVLPPNSGPCNSFNCLGQFKHVCDAAAAAADGDDNDNNCHYCLELTTNTVSFRHRIHKSNGLPRAFGTGTYIRSTITLIATNDAKLGTLPTIGPVSK